MGGGAGRGKFKGKPTGHRSFSRPEDIAAGTTSDPAWKQRRAREDEEAAPRGKGKEEEEDDDDDEDEDDEEERGGDDEEGKEEKQKGVSGVIEVENPNAPKKAAVKITQADASQTSQLSRREREELQKAASKERYMKLQEQGKTEQAAKDLERLATIRRQREEAAKKREEERLAKEAKKVDARK